MLGAPVDELTDLGEQLGDIVIARVTDVRQHPNADRLRICTVDAGGEQPLQVVCGAPNVEAGRFYPFAPVGSTIPGGMEIRKAKLRGETSEGMLCSARELGLGRDHSGLMTLAGEWETGASFRDRLQLDDARLVLDITPNRPDLLSHVGVARELAPGGALDLQLTAFGSLTSAPAAVAGGAQVSSSAISISVESPEDCPRYMAAVLEGVSIGPSPEWLATRLRAIGVRPINNVVDATNYVLHEIGQPLHAFDVAKLEGSEIRVRPATPGETIRTLDGVDRTLDGNALVIADRSRPVALAGIMGGEESEVTSTTTRILLECALFEPLRVRKTARGLGLSTDASHRFERGVDPEAQGLALARVTDLILAIAGGTLVPPVLDAHPQPKTRSQLVVRTTRVHQLLGTALPAEEIESLLRPIGFLTAVAGLDVAVEVPPFRPDVTREIDVIEEIARRRGYDSFVGKVGAYRPTSVPEDALLATQRKLRSVLASWGFLEARTTAFAPASEGRVPLLNPLSAEEGSLRDDLTRGLLRRLEHNWAHGVRAVRLYEIGSVFAPAAGKPSEEFRVAAVFTGPRVPQHWSEPPASFDIWDLKGLLTAVAESAGGAIVQGGPHRLFEESQAFSIISASGEQIGSGGRVPEALVDAPAWAEAVWAIELVIQPTAAGAARTYQALPAFPGVERDLALLMPHDLPAYRVEELLRARGGELLEDVRPFDLYAGKGIPEHTRSVAWRLRFRHPERTLTDSEVDSVITRQLQGLQEELGVQRR